jgi:hypothetical protein
LWIKDTPFWSGWWFWLGHDGTTKEHFFKVLGGGDAVLVGLGFISAGLEEGWGWPAEVLGCPTFGFFGAAVLGQELGRLVDSKPAGKSVVIGFVIGFWGFLGSVIDFFFRFDNHLFVCTVCILLLIFDLNRDYVVFELFDFSVRIEMKYVSSLPYKFFR